MTQESPKTVVHVSEVLATGILEYIKLLILGLPEFNHVIIYKTKKLPYSDENVIQSFPKTVTFHNWTKVHRPIHLINDLRAAIELYQILRKYKPRLIHLHSSKAGILGRAVAPFTNMRNKVIYTPNGAPFARTDISKTQKMFFLLCERIANRVAGKVICVSKSEANLYIKNGIPAQYINNGTESLPEFKAKKENSLPPTINIVTSGRVTMQKNPTLYNKLAEFFEPQKLVKFIWIGDGNLRDLLSSPNIKVTGWLSKEEVHKILGAADIYLSTASWEGLSFSVLEAMQHSLPIVATNCIGNTDLVVHRKNGFVIETFEEGRKAIDLLIKNADLRIEMGQASKRICDRTFSSEKMINQYRRLYNSI